MNREEIYDVMGDSDQRRVKLVTDEGESYTGYVDVFETRLDNEDDEGYFAGQGSICFYPDEGDPMLLYECNITSIRLLDRSTGGA